MYPRFVSLWHLLSTALLVCAFSLLVAPASRAGPAVGAVLYGSCTDSIRNGGFETGTFMYWDIAGSPTLLNTGGHTGSHSVLLGGRDNADDAIVQTFSCPYYGERVSRWAYVYMSTAQTQNNDDYLEIGLQSNQGMNIWDIYNTAFSAEGWWIAGTTDSYIPCEPGMTWTVVVRVTTDSSNPTTVLVDDVSLNVCCPDDAHEPDDSFGAARPASPGTYDVWLCPVGDEDWFQFDAAAGQSIVVDLTPAGALQGDLCLYRPDGGQKACSANSNAAAPEHIAQVADQTGSWRARVYDPEGGFSTRASQLQIQVSGQAAATVTPTPTATEQPPPTPTVSRTPTPTATQQIPATPTRTPTRTATGQPLATPTRTATSTPPGWTGQRVFLPVVVKRLWQPRPQDCSVLLANGGFESGGLASWSLWGDVGLGPGRNSASGAWLGGRDNAGGELWQWVTIPAGAAPVPWEFWWKAEAASPQPADRVQVYVESGGVLTPLLYLTGEAPLNEWRYAMVDLSPWAGHPCMVTFQVLADGAVPTTFRVDDVSVRACQQP
jgi:hypothetical protein